MSNATDTPAPVVAHSPWCHPIEHARVIEDGIGCVGRLLTQPIAEDQAEVDGWWHANDDGFPEPVFCLAGVGEFTAANLRALAWHLEGAGTPRAIALRALIARALAELEM